MKNFYYLTILSTLAAVQIHAQGTAASQPNVVFIYGDDLGRGMLSHYGQKLINTPNIDQLFQRGVSFENAYGCMFSAPSRASMLTGYHDCHKDKWNITGGGKYKTVKNYEDLEKLEDQLNKQFVELPQGDLLLPQVFKKAGYVTGQYGKLDWGFSATRQQIRQHGWDDYCGYMDHQQAHCFYPHFLIENDSLLFLEGNTHPTEGRGFESETPTNYAKRWDMRGKNIYSQDLFLERMLDFIRKHKDEKFFLYHSTQLSHGPVAVKKVHPLVKNRKDLTELEKEYATMVLMLDDHIGILLNELKRLGLYENTIFIFSVDNGHETYCTVGNRCRKAPNLDMEGRQFDAWNYPLTSERTGDYFDGNNGFSGKKWMNWEGGIRVPLVFTWPGHIPEGRTIQQTVANYDLLPTFADLLNVELTYPKDGESLVPILLKNKKKLKKERYVYVSSYEGPAVIDSEHWKLRYNRAMKKYRLHYLPEDKKEEVILNDKYPKVFKRLKAKLDAVINSPK